MPNNIDKKPGHDETIGWSALARRCQRGDIDPPHYHVEGQLLYATQGVMLVDTRDKHRVIPPQRALWLPALQEHSYSLLSHTGLRTLCFSRSLIDVCSRLPKVTPSTSSQRRL